MLFCGQQRIKCRVSKNVRMHGRIHKKESIHFCHITIGSNQSYSGMNSHMKLFKRCGKSFGSADVMPLKLGITFGDDERLINASPSPVFRPKSLRTTAHFRYSPSFSNKVFANLFFMNIPPLFFINGRGFFSDRRLFASWTNKNSLHAMHYNMRVNGGCL